MGTITHALGIKVLNFIILNKMYLPPASNTGVQNTRGAKMIQDNKLNSVKFENGLSVCIDYLGFTITASMSVDDVITFMGFDLDLFEEMPKGSDGYMHMRKCSLNGIAVLYDGNENMGIHVNVTGKGIASLLESFYETLASETPFGKGYDLWNETVLSRFFKEVLEIGHFSRIDTAIDDKGANYYIPQELDSCWHNGEIVTRFRSERIFKDSDAPNHCSGCTTYFGSRSSSLMLRVYDKQLEQNKNLKPTDDNYIDFPWIRWELEFKKERADELAKQLVICDEHGIGSIVMGVLYYYFRIIQFNDSNRSRCSNAVKWNDFVNCVEKLRLCVPKREKTLFDKECWIDSQVAPTLSLLLLINGGDVNFLNYKALQALPRISNSDKQMLRSCYPDIYAQYFNVPDNIDLSYV